MWGCGDVGMWGCGDVGMRGGCGNRGIWVHTFVSQGKTTKLREIFKTLDADGLGEGEVSNDYCLLLHKLGKLLDGLSSLRVKLVEKPTKVSRKAAREGRTRTTRDDNRRDEGGVTREE
jgi:hypothetical protein